MLVAIGGLFLWLSPRWWSSYLAMLDVRVWTPWKAVGLEPCRCRSFWWFGTGRTLTRHVSEDGKDIVQIKFPICRLWLTGHTSYANYECLNRPVQVGRRLGTISRAFRALFCQVCDAARPGGPGGIANLAKR